MRIGFILVLVFIHVLALVYGATREEGMDGAVIHPSSHGSERPLDKLKRVLRMEGLTQWIIQTMIDHHKPGVAPDGHMTLTDRIGSLEKLLGVYMSSRPLLARLQQVSHDHVWYRRTTSRLLTLC